jgi:hypothetical protein
MLCANQGRRDGRRRRSTGRGSPPPDSSVGRRRAGGVLCGDRGSCSLGHVRHVVVQIHIAASVERVFDAVSDHKRFLSADDGTRTNLLREGTAERNGLGCIREVRLDSEHGTSRRSPLGSDRPPSSARFVRLPCRYDTRDRGSRLLRRGAGRMWSGHRGSRSRSRSSVGFLAQERKGSTRRRSPGCSGQPRRRSKVGRVACEDGSAHPCAPSRDQGKPSQPRLLLRGARQVPLLLLRAVAAHEAESKRSESHGSPHAMSTSRSAMARSRLAPICAGSSAVLLL